MLETKNEVFFLTFSYEVREKKCSFFAHFLEIRSEIIKNVLIGWRKRGQKEGIFIRFFAVVFCVLNVEGMNIVRVLFIFALILFGHVFT